MKVIIHNDDFGLTYGFTEAIKDSFLKGITTSTSIRTNGMAYDYGVKLLKDKLNKIGLGLHLNLVDGPSHTAVLANSLGNYRYNFLQYLLLSKNGKTIKDIETELDWQFQQVLKDGLKIDHVSGHNHTYMIPAIFEIVCRLCKKYHVKSIRLPSEPYYLTGSLKKDLQPFLNSNIIKFSILNFFSQQNLRIIKKYRLKTTDAFYGVLHTNNMDLLATIKALTDAQNRGFKMIEILGHPAYANDTRDKNYTSNLIKDYVHSRNRSIETHTFQSEQLKRFLKQRHVIPITYRNI